MTWPSAVLGGLILAVVGWIWYGVRQAQTEAALTAANSAQAKKIQAEDEQRIREDQALRAQEAAEVPEAKRLEDELNAALASGTGPGVSSSGGNVN